MNSKNKNGNRPESLLKHQKLTHLFFLIYALLFVFSIFYLCIHTKIIITPGYFRLGSSLAYGYWITISFVLIQIGLGQLTFRLPVFRDSDLYGIPFLIFSFGIGFYISNCILTLLAIFKWIDGLGLYIYLLLSIPLLFFGFKTIIDSTVLKIKSEENEPDSNLKRRWLVWLIGSLLILWILPYFIQTFLPNTDWDGAWQHLPLSKLFLEKGISWVNPSFMQYNFPGTVHLVYSLFFFIKAESAIIPFNFIIALGIVIAVYSFAKHFYNKTTSRLAALITAAINIIWEVSITPRIDSFLAFFCLLAIYAFFLWLQDSKKAGLLIITGMMLGMAIGIKYTAALFILALSLLTGIQTLLNSKTKSVIKIVPLFLTLAVLFIPSGWWYMRNTIALGDPIYPFISKDIFYDNNGNKTKFHPALDEHLKKMPPQDKIEKVFDQTGLSSFNNYEKTVNVLNKNNLFNLWDVMRHPDKYQRKPYHEITPFLFLFFILPFFDRSKISLYLYGVGCFVFVLIAAKTHVLRYALPVFPIFSIGAAQVLARLRSKKLLSVAIVLIAIFLVRFSYLETKKLIEMRPWAYLSGTLEKIDWLTKVGYNWDVTMPSFIKFVNGQIADGSMKETDTLFMIGEGKGNLLNCNFLPDSSRNAMPWLEELIRANNDYSIIIKNLKQRSINYIAVNYFYLYWCFTDSNEYPKSLVFGLYHLQLFLENHTEIIYNRDGIVLAKIK